MGDVYDMAKVKINGNDVATLWTKPFVIEITEFINEGENDISITIANRWINRLIGDEQLPSEEIDSENNSDKK